MSESESDGAIGDDRVNITEEHDNATSAATTGQTQVQGETTESPDLDPSREPPYTHTRASGFWAAVVVGLLILLILIVFILENGQRASVSFFGAHGHLPQGVALLLAAVIGGLFVVLAGMARILQLRNRARAMRTTRSHKNHRRRSTQPATQ